LLLVAGTTILQGIVITTMKTTMGAMIMTTMIMEITTEVLGMVVVSTIKDLYRGKLAYVC
jgi:hypothetical protein